MKTKQLVSTARLDSGPSHVSSVQLGAMAPESNDPWARLTKLNEESAKMNAQQSSTEKRAGPPPTTQKNGGVVNEETSKWAHLICEINGKGVRG